MQHLLDGYRRYRTQRWPHLQALHRQLAGGQTPKVLVIGCCDSRVDPATIFDANPGELFVVRNVANLAPPYETGGGYHGTSAAIEFAVERLEVETILVLGHAGCGGVKAALALDHHAPTESFLDAWVGLLDPAKERIRSQPGDPQVSLEYESIRVTLENLLTFPAIAERVANGRLKLAGARYGVADGQLEVLDPNSGAFGKID